MLGMAGTILGMMQTYNEAFNEFLNERLSKGQSRTAYADRVIADFAAVRLASRDVMSKIWTAAGFITGAICAVMGVVLVFLSGLKFQWNSSTPDASVSTSA